MPQCASAWAMYRRALQCRAATHLPSLQCVLLSEVSQFCVVFHLISITHLGWQPPFPSRLTSPSDSVVHKSIGFKLKINWAVVAPLGRLRASVYSAEKRVSTKSVVSRRLSENRLSTEEDAPIDLLFYN